MVFRPRTSDEVAAADREAVLRDVAASAGLTPTERLERLAALLAALTPIARASPHWERFAAPEPLAPADQARWERLVRQHGR